MKKNEIKIGEVYSAKVSDRVVPVRIDSTNSHGGWNATNTHTGKRIHIKSAQRLRRAVTPKTKPAAELEAKPDITPTVEIITGQPLPADKAAAVAAKPKRTKKTDAGEAKPKRVSMLDAAAEVMKAEAKPMHTKEVIDLMASRGPWTSPGGKTPHATLDAAIRREIKTKPGAARFAIAGRGLFQFNA